MKLLITIGEKITILTGIKKSFTALSRIPDNVNKIPKPFMKFGIQLLQIPTHSYKTT